MIVTVTVELPLEDVDGNFALSEVSYVMDSLARAVKAARPKAVVRLQSVVAPKPK